MSQLSALRYSTKSQDATDHPYIYFNLDDNGNGTYAKTILFIPANNQALEGASKADVWQTWDALNGIWNLGTDTGPGDAVPLSTFGSSGILGIRIASGCSVTTDTPRAHNTDDFVIGVGGASPTVYDFERN